MGTVVFLRPKNDQFKKLVSFSTFRHWHLYGLVFYLEFIESPSSLDHDLMAVRKSHFNFSGKFEFSNSYLITAVTALCRSTFRIQPRNVHGFVEPVIHSYLILIVLNNPKHLCSPESCFCSQ